MFSDVAIAFWMSDYIRDVFKSDEDIIFLTYSVIRFTAPTLGMVISGIIVQKYGGYEGKQAPIFVLVFSIMEGFLGVFLTQLDKLEYFAIVLWCVTFLFGCRLPIFIGISELAFNIKLLTLTLILKITIIRINRSMLTRSFKRTWNVLILSYG